MAINHPEVWEANAAWFVTHHFSFSPTFSLEAYYFPKELAGVKGLFDVLIIIFLSVAHNMFIHYSGHHDFNIYGLSI